MKTVRECVTIIGSGMMGAGIAACAAAAGKPVVLYNKTIEKAEDGRRRARIAVEELRAGGLLSMESAEAAGDLIRPCADLPAACADARFVIEAIYEDLPLKQEMFRTLDGLLPADVPILSNTSGLRITDIAARMQNPCRALTAHFWFPGHLVPLVEIVVGEKSDPELAERIRDELSAWGKAPVVVKRDLPGQLANRVLQAIIREAVNIVDIGLASVEDVDRAVKMGLGIRLPAWGPLEHADGVGLELCRGVQNAVLPGISGSQTASSVWTEKIERGETGYAGGKGFYDWRVKDMDALAKNRNDFIIAARKILGV